jgi:4'-phosphopantetheinyl transferase
MQLQADEGRIDLWCTCIGEIADEALWPRYDALLSAEERARQGRFRFTVDQRRHLVTRALVRTVLSRYAPVRPQDWSFSAGPRGRPAIAAPTTEPPLEFNVSHSADLVLVGVTTGRRLGVDVEWIEGHAAETRGLDRYFTAQESEALLALPPEQRRGRFFELWTLKEAYIKSRGLGLAIALDSFRFEFMGEREVKLLMSPTLPDSPAAWRLWQLAPRPGYLAAVCAARGEPSPPRITLRELVPLAQERTIGVELLRSTR